MIKNLVQLNNKLIITINSQPQINGIRSNDPIHGWGPKDGYVYQKQYLEFLLPREKLPKLEAELKDNEMLTYFAVDSKGTLTSNHPDGSRANAVTWGIFPGREVLQPTIVEKVSFLAWKEEFYYILQEWELNFQENEKLESAHFLQHLIDDFVLVNIVDNDYVSKEDHIFALLMDL